MGLSGEHLWTSCLEIVRSQVTQKTYDTWIAHLKFVSYNDNDLTVSAPNEFVKEFIEEHCIEALKKGLYETFGTNVRLLYSIPRDNAETTKKEPQQPYGTAKVPKLDSNLSWNYTFENFVEGTSNRLALTVAKSIARNPDQATFNPFFIYGPSGIGKTHLANAIGMSVLQQHPSKRVLFVPVHVFQAQYTQSVKNNKFNDFVAFYQTIDVLIIDDVQELTTPKTQLVFFHIFNHLHQNKRYIVLTCDRAPSQLEGLEERMLTRFKWGMTAEIERPDIQLRKDILISKTYVDGLTVSEEVIDYIAQNVSDSVRELEGVVNSMMAYSIALNREIDCELAEQIIAKTIKKNKKDVTLEKICKQVCAEFGVKIKDIASTSRKKEIVGARQLAMYLCRQMLSLPYLQIGKEIGKRDHTTVMHSCKQVENQLSIDADYRKLVDRVQRKIKG